MAKQKNYQKKLANQSIELAELQQKIAFYKQQQNLYKDNIAHQKLELENNKNQTEK